MFVASKRFLTQASRNVVFRQSKYFASETAAATELGNDVILNFATPHQTIYNKKNVAKVVLPGEGGEYGVTSLHSPIISQLQPGVVTIEHTGGETEQFFIPGGFAITNSNNVTDVSATEAFPLSEFSPEEVKAGLDAALKNEASASDDIAKATSEIQVRTYSNLARALGLL